MMDCYLQEVMLRERKAEVERRAALQRMLRVDPPPGPPKGLSERVARWLRQRSARPRPTLIPHTKGR